MGPRQQLSPFSEVFRGPVDRRKKDQKRLLTGKRARAYTPRLIANGAADKAGTDAADGRAKAFLSADV
jgi:hypothetical protein